MRCGAPSSVTRPEVGLDGVRLWWALCLLLALPAAALGLQPVALAQAVAQWPALPQALVLRPELGWHQPAWTWWTSAWLHGSTPHLLRNLAALVLLAALGGLLRPRAQAAAAWCLAWPLTQLGMLLEPALSSYVGLSGVLHAGVVALALPAVLPPLRHPTGAEPSPGLHPKWLAWALLSGVALKILMENPWQHTLVASSASAINVAPWAHLSGAAAGALATGMLRGVGWCARPHR